MKLLLISMLFLPNSIYTDHFFTGHNNRLIQEQIKPTKQENFVFRHVMAEGKKGNYVVKGEVKGARTFYYSVEDGHNEFITEKQYLFKNSSDWGPFHIPIHIPENQLPHHASLIMNLYERSNDGDIINLYPVLLERFNK